MPTKLCYFGCKLDVPMHRFPKPGYYNEARFNMWFAVLSEETKLRGTSYILIKKYLHISHQYRALDSENSETASSTEETLPKASTSKVVYKIRKQSKPRQQRAESKKKVFYIEKIKNFKTYQLLKMRLLKLQK
ncbi:unnamed protein product [Parnassius apollo]|uniref:(apollo) hypothetical protein n=1 Tax=Parnassius apollo TaxID=110799 RepID=A0A8S3W6V7_PARAO|nr:unnamed protein product [Parnassius apollo]